MSHSTTVRFLEFSKPLIPQCVLPLTSSLDLSFFSPLSFAFEKNSPIVSIYIRLMHWCVFVIIRCQTMVLLQKRLKMDVMLIELTVCTVHRCSATGTVLYVIVRHNFVLVLSIHSTTVLYLDSLVQTTIILE